MDLNLSDLDVSNICRVSDCGIILSDPEGKKCTYHMMLDISKTVSLPDGFEIIPPDESVKYDFDYVGFVIDKIVEQK